MCLIISFPSLNKTRHLAMEGTLMRKKCLTKRIKRDDLRSCYFDEGHEVKVNNGVLLVMKHVGGVLSAKLFKVQKNIIIKSYVGGHTL